MYRRIVVGFDGSEQSQDALEGLRTRCAGAGRRLDGGPAGGVRLDHRPRGVGSTLLHLIAGFERPDSGSVVVGDLVTASVRDVPRYRREVVGFVFQLHHLLPALTAQTNVELALLGGGMAAPERRERARLLLELVGVGHRAEHLPKELSGGERQCVAVARALANRPRILLADEPTSALDPVAAGRILDLLDAIRAAERTTVIAVSHDPAVAGRADRQLLLEAGRLRESPAAAHWAG